MDKMFEHAYEEYFLSPQGEGSILRVRVKSIPFKQFFRSEEDELFFNHYRFYQEPLLTFIDHVLSAYHGQNPSFACSRLWYEEGVLCIEFSGYENELPDVILSAVQRFYQDNPVHITRMFGSYILLANDENGELKAIRATSIPLSHCPLMFRLLKEVGGAVAEQLLETLKTGDDELQRNSMCDLINEVVIQGGYFDTSRPLNSCEANVAFGASETIYSAFEDGLLDAAVIVSNNLGTIIATNASATQGAVKRMTGLFYTSPSAEIMKTAEDAGIIPVFPHTATIDQIAGVRKAIALGYRRIAVTVASADNIQLNEIAAMEKEYDMLIYKFGLCSTGIDEAAADAMMNHADLVWSCASKYVSEKVEPNAIGQVGVKIPVHIMTKQGWELVNGHLKHMDNRISFDDIQLAKGENKPVFLNDEELLKCVPKKDVFACDDCPYPCV